MTTPTGTPDWLKPIPGGSHKLVDAVLAAGPNSYLSGILDVTKYNGLYVEIRGTGPAATFVIVDIHYYDDPAGTVSTTTWQGSMRANETAVLNVPTLGPYAQVDLTAVGGAPFTASRIIMVGHNGGPSSSVHAQSLSIFDVQNASVTFGTALSVDVTFMSEGPGHFMLATGPQPGVLGVFTVDSAGGLHPLAQLTLAGNAGDTRALWIPPQPVRVVLTNVGVGTSGYNAGLWLGRP